MNNSYYETLDKNFEQALKLYEKDYTHEELIELLKNGNIVQKQISALRLENIASNEEAEILLNNLTGQDGKIREAISFRLKEFMGNSETIKFFSNKDFCEIFLNAVIDINANICRNVISAISNLKDDEMFCANFLSNLTGLTLDLIGIIEKFDIQEGKYKVNKEVFKLYWCLETIYEFFEQIEIAKLKKIILRGKNIQEYTIREKIAKLLTKDFNDIELENAKKELQNDSNYYVRIIFSKST